MEKLTLNVPAMYGDHHVTEVRQILLELDGVDQVYASSSFHVVEVMHDPSVIDAGAIQAVLEQAGYLDDPMIPFETGKAALKSNGGAAYFRHTTASAQTGTPVSFAQQVSYAGRPLWPCPGMGVIKQTSEENLDNG